MQKITILTLSVAVAVLLLLQGFSPKYHFPQIESETTVEETVTSAAPDEIIKEVYYTIEIAGIEEATPERLELDFGISPDTYRNVWGRYSDGRFGVADLIIMQAYTGGEEEVMSALQSIKSTRISTFQNYDVFNSLEISSDGVVLESGEYFILIMMENQDEVAKIVEDFLPK